MNTRVVFAFIFLSAVTSGFSEPTQQEVIALMNKVEARVAAGDASALDDLLTLPGNWAVPALIDIFKENYVVYGATPQMKAIGKKAALLATTVSGGEEYLTKLLKKKPDDDPNWVFIQQDMGIKALIVADNKTAVRLFCGALDEPEIGARAANALAAMNLPGAPYASKDKSGRTSASAESINQWKQWWDSNASNYAGNGDSQTVASPSP
jgi:hypothetical protein